jgi:Raf kinase inhibitor-like YbhB/YbcL family protein
MTLRKRTWWLLVGVVLMAVFVLGFFFRARRRLRRSDIAYGQAAASMSIGSSSFSSGGPIPPRLTCDGAGLSPDIQLPPAPSGTKSFVLVMDDPDASGFVHWLAYNIPADTRDIAEGAASRSELPHGTAEGLNSLDKIGYFGPCPPGTKPHHYVFQLYALDVDLDLPAGQTKKQLAAAVKGHVLAKGRMTGLYSRGSDKPE